MPVRPSLVVAVATYAAKMWVAGVAAAVLVPLAALALAVDLALGTSDRADARARRVLRASARLEALIDVHGDLTDVRVTEERGAVYSA